jgi:polyferredoxin
MGIDIRNGQQLACITCGLCIDACDDMMDKIGKPRGLIGYLALTDEVREREGKAPKSVWSHVFRLRTMIYTVLWSAVGIALVVALFMRTEIDVNVTPVRNPQFVVLKDGSIRNTYELRLLNKHGDDRLFSISSTNEEGAEFVLALEGQDALQVLVPANQTKTQRLYITATAGSEAAEEERTELRLWIEDLGSDAATGTDRVHHDTVFNGKEEA